MTASHHTPLKIGEWRVDPSLDEITREGKTVKLEPRAMRILVCLAEHAGQVVSVERLLDAVWKDVVVTPDSVYQAVAALRKALGDDTKEPAYIANVLRRGYRLLAPVTPWVAPPPFAGTGPPSFVEPSGPPPTDVPVKRSVAPWGAWIVLAIAIVCVGGLVARNFVGSREAQNSLHPMKPEVPGVDAPWIVVLPFLDLSSSKDQQYFADGLTEELIERLSKVPRLRVVARTSSFYFKGRQATVAEIARTLGVAYLLDGSVRKSGDTLRITSHLVRAHDGHDLWSETYDQPIKDVFRVQDQIAGAVVQALKLSIVTSPSQGVPIFTTNADAHMVYLRALAHLNNATSSDYDAAESELHSVLILDPRFATAWAVLSMVTIWKFEDRASNPTVEACTRARDTAARALQLDPSLSLSHRAKGIVLQTCDENFQAAEAEFKRALELHPDDSLVLMSQARLADQMGRTEQAIKLALQATAADPLNFWTFAALGDVSLYAGHVAEAEAAYRKAVDIDSSAAFIHSSLAIALLTNHKPAEAVAESEREPEPQYRAILLPIALDAAGRHSDGELHLAELKLRYGEENADWVGLFYACRHDPDNAMQWLRIYAAKHTHWMRYQPYLQECLRTLESDPRYQLLEQQMKLAKPQVGLQPR